MQGTDLDKFVFLSLGDPVAMMLFVRDSAQTSLSKGGYYSRIYLYIHQMGGQPWYSFYAAKEILKKQSSAGKKIIHFGI